MRYRSLRVFSLGGWSLRLPTGFPVSRGTLVQLCATRISPTRLSRSVDGFPKPIRLSLWLQYCCPQPRGACTAVWTVPRPLAATGGIEFSFFSSGYLDVSVYRLTSVRLWIYHTVHRVCLCGLPHSEISGSTGICPSPKLFAACHVLHRLSVPRHPPCALHARSYYGRPSCHSVDRKPHELLLFCIPRQWGYSGQKLPFPP